MPSGGDNVLTVHTNDGVERFRIDSSGNVKVGSAVTISQDGDVFFTGVCTATTLSGAASGLTGALPAIDGSALTGIAATDNVRTGILDVAGISTFRNTVNIGAAVTITESGIEATGVGITVANINGGAIGGRRNLLFNGDMRIAQRGTSSTSVGYQTCDRWYFAYGGEDEAPTQAQVDVSSGTSPYAEGFRKAYKITNGNQTSTGVTDYIAFLTSLEAQDLANSGWNYTSPSSHITLSFWAKSSVAKTFTVQLYTVDGTSQAYNHKYVLAANTWTKVIHTFPGHANVQFDNDANKGIEIQWNMYSGTNYTEGSTVDQWVTYNGNTSTPDDTDDWWTTNDATFEITGVQLEVGAQATPFEHRTFIEELTLCQRYYFQGDGQEPGASLNAYYGSAYSSSNAMVNIYFPTTMRAKPTVTNPTHGGGGSLAAVYETFNSIHVNISGDTSVNVHPSEIKCSAEL